MEMTGRERTLAAIQHREGDCVPIDLGGSDAATIMAGPHRRLCEHFGIESGPVYLPDIMEQCVVPDPRVVAALGCNSEAKAVYAWSREWRSGRAYDGTSVFLPAKFAATEMPDGSEHVLDHAGNVALKRPKDGCFFDVGSHPLYDVKTVSDLERHLDAIDAFDRPSWADEPLEETAVKLRAMREEGKFLVGCFLGHVFQGGQVLRGWGEFLTDLGQNPALAEALMERLVQGHMDAFDRYVGALGEHLDVVEVCDDLGMQDRTWVSPQMYRKLVKPHHARLYGHIKKRSGLPLALHSCGSIYPLIPDLIEIGVDILNPVQYSARDMGLARLKREFGDDLCFWGGGVDTQHVLPFGSPQEVRDEVKRNLDIMAPGGGYVFAAVHNLVEGVPTENIVAAYEAATEFGRY